MRFQIFYGIYFILSTYTQLGFAQIADTSKITNISIDDKGHLKWTVLVPPGSYSQQVESFRNGKWDTIYSTKTEITLRIGKKININSSESAKIELHHGSNKLRIRVTSPYSYISKEITIYKKGLDIGYPYPIKVDSVLTFSSEIQYEIYDKRFKSVLKGSGTKANLSKLKRGTYYLQYDTLKSCDIIFKK